MNPVDREGTFRAEITEYGVREADSGAVSIAIRCHLTEWWDGNDWQPWLDYDVHALGDIYIVKRDGTLNEPAVQSLIKHAGWDGDISSVVNGAWQPTKCAVSVGREEYKGQVRYKINFVNDWARTPGQLSRISQDRAQELAARFGSQLRAISGNAMRAAAPVVGAPPKPPAAAPRSAAPAPPPAPRDQLEKDHNDIPF